MSVEFKDYSVEIKSEINQKSLSFLEAIASEIESQVVKNSRVDTGYTKRNWKHYVEQTELKAYIGNELENAFWEEFGTGEYAVNKDGRPTPWYVPVEKVKGKKKPTFNGKVEIIYGKNGRAFYKTNGKKPSRSFTKAFETVKPKVERQAEKIFGGTK